MPYYNQSAPSSAPRIPIRLILAIGIALFSIVTYFLNSSTNPVTGRTQHIKITPSQEVALGLQSAPQMAQEFGGLTRDPAAARLVKDVGTELVRAIPDELVDDAYRFDFHLLADTKTVNAFALPGGQIFITEALLTRLESRGQLAGVLGHEIGHVLARHSAEQMAKTDLVQGLVGAAATATSDGYGRSSGGQIAQFVGQFTLLKYSRDHELESDRLGIRFMVGAGYDPRSMIGVMKILEKASGGGSRQEFMATHPNPGHRIEELQRLIAEYWPQGLPAGLRP